ncbi:helix-turn-helix domain-containing protein [Desulfovibrio sp.]|uniref:helix-turn-helix domain-containing protein n=1 Tax=Desulfovibrio sp. TaxID=885 RepID=UPI0025BC7BBD|nr:helix-turn-helix transcriptional regulator [Desulfovibrio sp.]
MKNCPNLLEALAITVEAIRKERKLTKLAVASDAELQDCYVRGITKGRRNPTITALYAICEALNVSPVEFFRRVEEERANLEKSGKE